MNIRRFGVKSLFKDLCLPQMLHQEPLWARYWDECDCEPLSPVYPIRELVYYIILLSELRCLSPSYAERNQSLFFRPNVPASTQVFWMPVGLIESNINEVSVRPALCHTHHSAHISSDRSAFSLMEWKGERNWISPMYEITRHASV